MERGEATLRATGRSPLRGEGGRVEDGEEVEVSVCEVDRFQVLR